jgi:integrase
MARAQNRLGALFVKNAKGPATYRDGAGLILRIDERGNKRWVYRYQRNQKVEDISLGTYPTVSLEAARKLAQAERERVAMGITSRVTFRRVFEDFFKHHERGLRNDTHKAQWRSTIEDYATPLLDKPIASIRAADIHSALSEVWHEHPETAGRVMQRIAKVFDHAIAADHVAASPCPKAKTLLGKLKKTVKNHAALPYQEVPQFVAQLRSGAIGGQYMTRLAFEFLILTAARSGEVRLMPRAEIDLDANVWVVPADRMKMEREHRVPLSTRAIEIIKEADAVRGENALTFPAPRGGAMSDMTLLAVLRRAKLPATVHGFRSSFKMWCAEVEQAPDEVSERALAHVDSNDVRAAYLRSDFLEQRKVLMEKWARFLASNL